MALSPLPLAKTLMASNLATTASITASVPTTIWNLRGLLLSAAYFGELIKFSSRLKLNSVGGT